MTSAAKTRPQNSTSEFRPLGNLAQGDVITITDPWYSLPPQCVTLSRMERLFERGMAWHKKDSNSTYLFR